MKLLTILRALFATCLIAAATAATASPTLIVTNGILMGANNVSVNGTLYNVKFADGSCYSLFNGCVQSAFAFNTQANALSAAQSLLDTVFIDGPNGKFNTVGNTTFGCSGLNNCSTLIPHANAGANFNNAYSLNFYNVYTNGDRTVSTTQANETDYSAIISVNFAIFQLADATTIPEPGTIALLGLAWLWPA